MVRNPFRLALVLVLALLPWGAAAAGARVEFEVVLAENSPQLDVQGWFRLLTDLKADNVQIRGPRGDEKIEVTTAGGKTSPLYKVQGQLSERNELILPGGKFRLQDRAALAAWIARLREYGPEGPKQHTTPFGLSDAQWKALRADLSRPIAKPTKGAARADVLAAAAAELKHRVEQAAGTAQALEEAGPLAEELQGLSTGTAIACLLRPAGLALVARPDNQRVELQIVKAASSDQVWPVGLPADDKIRDKLPSMYEFIHVEIAKGTPLAKALDVIQQRLAVPLLLDHNSLALAEVDVEQATVFFPPGKSTVSLILRRILGQHKLKYQMRLDEADRPFLWITTFRP
jgi:hypothetical protein